MKEPLIETGRSSGWTFSVRQAAKSNNGIAIRLTWRRDGHYRVIGEVVCAMTWNELMFRIRRMGPSNSGTSLRARRSVEAASPRRGFAKSGARHRRSRRCAAGLLMPTLPFRAIEPGVTDLIAQGLIRNTPVYHSTSDRIVVEMPGSIHCRQPGLNWGCDTDPQ